METNVEELLFPPYRRGKVARIVSQIPKLSLLTPRQKIVGIVRKVPEVLVKISGASKDFNRLCKHVEYISRNGEVELQDEHGYILSGKKVAIDKIENWKNDQDIPYEHGTKREAFHVVLSMPAGTSRDKVRQAANEFARDVFRGHEYLMAEHRDEAHSHVHILVKAVGEDDKRLNPRKKDLQAWRETFAVKLHDQGIEANATKRVVRGRTRRAIKQPVLHAAKEKRPLNVDRMRRQEIASLIKHNRNVVIHPILAKSMRSRKIVTARMGEWARNLRETGLERNVVLADAIEKYYRNLPPVESIQQAAINAYRRSVAIKKER